MLAEVPQRYYSIVIPVSKLRSESNFATVMQSYAVLTRRQQ
jgi:hypothetical protein